MDIRAWGLLLAAIILEVIGTTSLRLSDGFTKLGPSVLMVLCYIGSFGLLGLTVKRMDLGVAYAVWAGLGTALTFAIAAVLFKEAITPAKLISVGLIIAGVVGLNFARGGH